MSLTHFLLWSARILGIAVSLFLGLFALDAFTAGSSFDRALVDFAVHLLPAAIVMAIVIMAWERPRVYRNRCGLGTDHPVPTRLDPRRIRPVARCGSAVSVELAQPATS